MLIPFTTIVNTREGVSWGRGRWKITSLRRPQTYRDVHGELEVLVYSSRSNLGWRYKLGCLSKWRVLKPKETETWRSEGKPHLCLLTHTAHSHLNYQFSLWPFFLFCFFVHAIPFCCAFPPYLFLSSYFVFKILFRCQGFYKVFLYPPISYVFAAHWWDGLIIYLVL